MYKMHIDVYKSIKLGYYQMHQIDEISAMHWIKIFPSYIDMYKMCQIELI